MLQFKVDAATCTGCGLCAKDCLPGIIELSDGRPAIQPEREGACLRCQHCFTVCAAGALSIFGLDPADSTPLKSRFVEPEKLEALITGRRSIRQYRPENVDPGLIDRLLEVAWASPTGSNRREVHFILIDDREQLRSFNENLMAALGRRVRDGGLPEPQRRFAGYVRAWEERRVDTLFRNAPHLLVATAPADAPSGPADCVIALSAFDLLAQASGIGTVWDGLAKTAIDVLVPEFRKVLGVPDDHIIGHIIAFGLPAVRYARTAQRGKPPVHRVVDKAQ